MRKSNIRVAAFRGEHEGEGEGGEEIMPGPAQQRAVHKQE